MIATSHPREAVGKRKPKHSSARAAALAVIKTEVVRIGTNETRTGFKFAEAVFRAIPELRNV